MKRPSVQTALKATLLVVLAMNLKVPQAVQVTNMSAVSPESRSGSTVQFAPNLSDTDVETSAAPLSDADAIPTDTPFVRTICKKEYVFSFSEEKIGSRTRIELSATLGGAEVAWVPRTGKLSEIAKDENAKIDLSDILATGIQGKFCPDGAAQDTHVAYTPATRPSIREGLNTCLVNSAGRKLTDDAQLDCNQKIIDKVSELDVTSTREKKKNAKKNLVDAVHRMEKIIKAGLVSDEDDDVDAASGRIDDLMTAIQDIPTTIVDPATHNKLINELRAMKTGADTRRKAKSLDKLATELNQRGQEVWNNFQQMDQQVRNRQDLKQVDKMQLMSQNSSQLMSFFQQHNQFTQAADNLMSQNLADLTSFQSQSLMSQADMSMYLSPYNNLQKSVLQMVNPNSMGINNLMYVPRDPFFLASANSIIPQNGTLAAALMQQQTTIGGKPLPFTQQQMATYGLTSGALLDQQNFDSQLLTTPGIQTTSLGPIRVYPQQVDLSGGLNGNLNNSLNGGFNNGFNSGLNGGLNNGINPATGMGVGALGPVQGNGNGAIGGTNSVMFRQVH